MNKLCGCGCGKEVTNDTNRFINGHCNRGRKDLYIKRAKNYKEKYGVESSNQLESVKEKKKQSYLKHYGVEHPLQSKEVQKKFKQTSLNHYGFENPNQSKEVQRKFRQTCLDKYGVENPNKLIEVKEKKKQTCLKNNRTEHPSQSNDVKEKSKQTCLKNYGVENPYQSKEIQEKVRQTNLLRYGVDHYSKTVQGRELSRINCIRMTENQKFNGEPLYPVIGDSERLFLDELQKYTPYNIIRNDNSFRYIIGRFPDGHIPELKLFIQFDEQWHDNTEENDSMCTLQLASLGYIVYRVSEKQWKENKEKVLDCFKLLLLNFGK